MNTDPFLSGMLAWRQILGSTNPGLVESVREEWARWLHVQRTQPPDVSKPRLIAVADLSCPEDLTAHVGLAQLLALRSIRCSVVLSFPTAAMMRIVRAQARRDAWQGLVRIVDASERLQLLEGLPADSPLAVFPAPAILSPQGLEKMFATRHPWLLLPQQNNDGSGADAFVSGNGFFGRAGDYFEWQRVQPQPDEGAWTAASKLIQDEEFELGLASTPRMVFPRNPWPKVDSWLETAKSHEDGIDVPLVEGGDELIIRTYREPLSSTVIERRCGRLCAPDEPLKIRLPGSMLTTAPKIVRVESYKANGHTFGRNLLLRVPPSRLQAWMLSAFLNKGGGGNGVIRAFAEGVGCRLAYAEDEPDTLSDIPVVWGVLRDSDRILAQAKAQSLYFFYIDHAYFNRGHGRSYRITRNRYEAGAIRHCPDDRITELGVQVRPWRKSGKEIIVCPPTDYFMAAHDCSDWLETTLEALRSLTDRPIIVREKPKADETAVSLPQALKTAHALVTHSSNVAIEAACLGTPVFVAPASAAAPIGRTDLSKIEDPAYPDRSAWLAHLAYNQFSFDEIREGRAWKMLLELEEREFV